MNDRLIEQIVDTAAFATPGVYQIEYESGSRGVEFTDAALRVFVGLIVRECCTIADEVEQADMDSFVSKFIKAHFGVEQ
jgi:hypothetical protein